ncbi:hypothetical protein [Lachnospira multipara]|uniref:Uncharacterized protein n=1 Tax=Lachnospira multipara TaxID=28051 RepID=A0A1H5VVH3_9FIRM|nr:hypothetical protein [Lachnospira multipara]SEF90861.1 hypothetical protein SAMN05216537_112104 [Lachnospira multipara]
MVNFNLDWIFPLIVIAGFALATLLIINIISSLGDCVAEKQETKQSKIKELERKNDEELIHELKMTKDFPLIKVKDIKVGQIVCNSIRAYVCLDDRILDNEKAFFDLFSKKIVYIKTVYIQFEEEIEEEMRYIGDLNEEMSRMIREQNERKE